MSDGITDMENEKTERLAKFISETKDLATEHEVTQEEMESLFFALTEMYERQEGRVATIAQMSQAIKDVIMADGILH